MDYEYLAVDSSGKEVGGTLEADGEGEAIRSIIASGLYITMIKKVSGPGRKRAPAVPAAPKPEAEDLDPRAHAPRAIGLALLQAMRDKAAWVVFDCTPKGIKVQHHVQGNWYPLTAPPDDWADEILQAFRDISGEPKLGRGTVRKRATIDLGRILPDTPSFKAKLEFRSASDSPGRVIIKIR